MPRSRGGPARDIFNAGSLGTLPRLPRIKGFPVKPRIPGHLQPGGETDEERFLARFDQIRNERYPVMTSPEFRVFEWLERHYGSNSQGHDWEYTTSTLVSDARTGGIEVDFSIYAEGLLVWQVQGEFFHFLTPEQQSSDLVERLQLENAGYTVINMLANMIKQDVVRVCEAGLKGQQLYKDPILGGFVPTAEPTSGTRV